MKNIDVILVRSLGTPSNEDRDKMYIEFCAKYFYRFPMNEYPRKHTVMVDGRVLMFVRDVSIPVTNHLCLVPPGHSVIAPQAYNKGDIVMYLGSQIRAPESKGEIDNYKCECYIGDHPNPVQWFVDTLKKLEMTPYERVMAKVRRDEKSQEDIEEKVMRAIENLTEDQMESLAREGALPITGHYNIHILKPMHYSALVERVHKETKFRLKVKGEFIWLRV